MYCLAGLSAAQHRILPNEGRLVALEKAWVSGPGNARLASIHGLTLLTHSFSNRSS